MSYGLQIFDSSGGTLLDTTDRVMTLFGMYPLTLSAPTSSAPGIFIVSTPGTLTNGEFSGFINTNRCKIDVSNDQTTITIYPYYHVPNTGVSASYYTYELEDPYLYIFRY
jgi:hypothetical protein